MTDKFFSDYFAKKKKTATKPQELDNLYKVPKKDKGPNMPRFNVPIPNAVHQADLLFMPHDKGFKYALVVVDACNSVTDAEPLKNKNAETVKDAFVKIYARTILKMPERIEVDSGTEFKSVVAKYFADHNVGVRVAKVARHRQQAMVEKRNQIIGTVLFKRMVAQELLTEQPSTEWVDDLPVVIREMNKQVRQSPPKRPNDSDPMCKGDACNLIPKGTKVRVQLEQPQDVATGKRLIGKFRSTDIRWDPTPRTVKEILIKPGSPPMYLLNGNIGSRKIEPVAHTKNQLQVVPKNEEKPSHKLIADPKSKHQFVVEKILEKKKVKNRWCYKIKWAGWPEKYNSFEPVKIITEDVPKIAADFEKTLK